MFNFRILVATAALVAAVPAHAVSVTSLSGSTLYSIPADYFFYPGLASGPQEIATGITWSSDNPNSFFGYIGKYGFTGNGLWDGLSMIATGDDSSTMRIDFASAVIGVGAFMNWEPFGGGTPLIAIYDRDDKLIESYTLTFRTGAGTNTGQFHGFLQDTAIISYMTLSGAYIGAANLEVITAAVPEPETYALMLAGLAAVGAASRQRKAK